eukprot:1579128-Prymnesium_polylepis.1
MAQSLSSLIDARVARPAVVLCGFAVSHLLDLVLAWESPKPTSASIWCAVARLAPLTNALLVAASYPHELYPTNAWRSFMLIQGVFIVPVLTE